ncbi:MAG: hypothetical protein RID09_24170 [Coleofasciculus sp. G1-WW12-02]|uniref:hypothetical protein n=1 Tax=Coleofasciculus sp. G1-WW12-02 TaxID=3068483 RepID=UPI0032F5B48E
MTKKDMQRLLEDVKTAYKKNNETSDKIITMMRELAKARYTPAIEFFYSCLGDSRYSWRSRGLDILRSNYEFSPDSKIIKKIRDLLLNDPNYSVRIRAAALLSTQSKWPDPALKQSLISETNEEVLIQVFEAILILGGVPYSMVRTEVNRVRGGEIEPTFEEIERITQELADTMREQRLAQQNVPDGEI